jgi:hypothetical protein
MTGRPLRYAFPQACKAELWSQKFAFPTPIMDLLSAYTALLIFKQSGGQTQVQPNQAIARSFSMTGMVCAHLWE